MMKLFLINLLKLYKDNPDIQENGYIIIDRQK